MTDIIFSRRTQSIKTRARKTKASTGHKLEMGQNLEQYQRHRHNLHKLEWETNLHKLERERKNTNLHKIEWETN